MSNKKFIRIKETREDNGITQEEMANKLNISCSGYRKWETGEREFPLEELVMFADIVNVSIDYLLERTDLMILFNKEKK